MKNQVLSYFLGMLFSLCPTCTNPAGSSTIIQTVTPAECVHGAVPPTPTISIRVSAATS